MYRQTLFRILVLYNHVRKMASNHQGTQLLWTHTNLNKQTDGQTGIQTYFFMSHILFDWGIKRLDQISYSYGLFVKWHNLVLTIQLIITIFIRFCFQFNKRRFNTTWCVCLGVMFSSYRVHTTRDMTWTTGATFLSWNEKYVVYRFDIFDCIIYTWKKG